MKNIMFQEGIMSNILNLEHCLESQMTSLSNDNIILCLRMVTI